MLAQYRSDGLMGDDNTTEIQTHADSISDYSSSELFLTSIAVKTNLPQIAQISKS